MMRWRLVRVLVVLGVLGVASSAAAETLCDPSFQDCRTPLLNLINAETVGLDVAFWFMQDARYEQAILNRWNAGVPVRILVDPRANPQYPGNSDMIAAFQQAGIPIRYRTASGILHWKMMLFAGQNTVEFDGANYSPTAFIYEAPYSNYEDESIFFEDDPAVVNTFKTEYDNLWQDTTNYANYANVTGALTRVYPTFPMDADLNFPQQQDYALRILKRYTAETQAIDVIMYRITDERHTNAMIAAMQRGIPVRVYSDTFEYRDPTRLWVAYNLDKLYAAGVPLRVRAHDGLNHQKLVLLYGQGLSVFGSSNWTTPSANQQQEHNYFTTKAWIFQWFSAQFDRKWNNTAPNGAIESGPFTPLPPDKPVYQSPAAGAVGTDRSLELHWDGGPWGQLYDIYFGTDPNPPVFAANQQLGPTDPSAPTVTQKFALPLLQPGTTYYWKIVTKTMAGLSKAGTINSFTTAGNTPPPPPPASGATTVVLWTATDVPMANVAGNWQFLNDATAAGGKALWNPDHGQSRVSPPLAAPANYFQTTFTATAGVPYHVWLRLRAQSNSTSNNSVSFQFNDSIDQYGSPLYQIGTAEGGETNLQDPSGTLNNWGWADNGLGGPATLVYFPTTGTHTILIQQRSDGAIVDQIVLSPAAFLSAAPGGTLNDATIYGSTVDGAAPPPAPPAPPAPPPPIPAPWQQQDIGSVGMPGYASFDNGSSVFTSEGAGADVWGSADALHYIYQPLTGDGSIIARVASVQNTNVWSKAGVMIRETLTPGATNVFMLVSSAKGLSFQTRATTGGATTSVAGVIKAAPYWVRLDRAGNTFTAYQSLDGVTWAAVGSSTIAMSSNALVGLALTSHNADATAVTTIDHVLVNGAATCGYGVSPTTKAVSPGGDTATIALTTGSACTWTAASSDTSWLTVTSAASGSGSANVSLSAAPNGGAARAATVTIGGQVVTVTQSAPCSYSMSPTSQAFAVGGGGTSVVLTTGASCVWNATSSDPSWLTASVASGSGSSTIVVTAAANNGPARSATVTIGGQIFTASQPAAPCTYAISPASQSMAAAGDSGTVAVTTASSCSWTATSSATWLTVTSGASGTGNGTVAVSAAANPAGARSATVTIGPQVFTASQAGSTGSTGWSNQDIGAVGVAGSTTFDGTGTPASVTGAGADVWGTADALQFAYQPLSGDGSIVARVATIQNTNAWTKAGVMIRGTLDPGSAQAFMLVSFSKGLAFQRRTAAGGASISTTGVLAAAPYWVRLDRVGNTINAYQSPDGATWTFVDSSTIPMPSSVLIGLGVSSHTTTAAATAAFDQVAVTPGTPTSPTALPASWLDQDIGAVGAAGAASYSASSGTFSIKGGGADIWGTADALHFAYKAMTGDGVVVARVATIQNTNAWTKAGVMIRETLDPGSAQAIMLGSFSKGLAFQRRVATGGASTSTSGALVAAPVWVKLERIGSTFNAYSSSDGAAWTLVGTDTIPMAATVYVGLGVSSHTTATAALATFDHVSTP